MVFLGGDGTGKGGDFLLTGKEHPLIFIARSTRFICGGDPPAPPAFASHFRKYFSEDHLILHMTSGAAAISN